MMTGATAGSEPSGVPPMAEEDPVRREERDSLEREDPLSREERASLVGMEDPRPGALFSREAGRQEDKGLLDKAKEALTGEEREGREEPPPIR
jgi:hypothetical protein